MAGGYEPRFLLFERSHVLQLVEEINRGSRAFQRRHSVKPVETGLVIIIGALAVKRRGYAKSFEPDASGRHYADRRS
jgi:hypothetical protein